MNHYHGMTNENMRVQSSARWPTYQYKKRSVGPANLAIFGVGISLTFCASTEPDKSFHVIRVKQTNAPKVAYPVISQPSLRREFAK